MFKHSQNCPQNRLQNKMPHHFVWSEFINLLEILLNIIRTNVWSNVSIIVKFSASSIPNTCPEMHAIQNWFLSVVWFVISLFQCFHLCLLLLQENASVNKDEMHVSCGADIFTEKTRKKRQLKQMFKCPLVTRAKAVQSVFECIIQRRSFRSFNSWLLFFFSQRIFFRFCRSQNCL